MTESRDNLPTGQHGDQRVHQHDGLPDAEHDTLYSAVLSDILDSIGRRDQFLSPTVRPLTAGTRVSGRAFTVRARPVDRIPDEAYKLEMRAIEDAAAGDVLIVDAGHAMHTAFWGELLTTSAAAKGIRGIVMTACARDMWALEKSAFPVFGIGTSPGDCLGRLEVNALQQPIVVDGVAVSPGDFVFGDLDGVVVVPADVADEVLELARKKISGENTVRDELAAGLPISEVFQKYGVL